MEKPFSLAERARSFRYAFSGLAELLRSQHNARVHLFASLLVVIVPALLRSSGSTIPCNDIRVMPPVRPAND